MPAYKWEVDQIVARVRAEIIADAGPMLPQLFAFPPLGCGSAPVRIPVDPNLMDDWRRKNLIGVVIVAACFTARTRVTVFVSDALMGCPEPGKTLEDYPKNFAEWPKALTRESLLIAVNAVRTKGYVLAYPYTRDGKNRRVFSGEPELLEMSAGRFCYDLTEVDEAAAALDALHRNRDGVLKMDA